jgi:hypothetical protein
VEKTATEYTYKRMTTGNVFTIDPVSRDEEKAPQVDNKPTIVMDSHDSKSFLLKCKYF